MMICTESRLIERPGFSFPRIALQIHSWQDVRHEVNAVFAADAVGRLTGVPGVAAVTAGPGITNTVTAVQNAVLAQSPLVLLGGAAATMLKGRGSLQDVDQLARRNARARERSREHCMHRCMSHSYGTGSLTVA